MSGSRKFWSILLLVALVAGALALQRWVMVPETIRINNEAISVIDGDSFRSASDEFRIYGIDAPEYRQACRGKDGNEWPCGRDARLKLEELLRASDHECEVRARDRFGRAIASCKDGEGVDLGSAMVASGFALSGHEFNDVIYARQEAAAKRSIRGVWQGTFEHPKQWRDRNPRF